MSTILRACGKMIARATLLPYCINSEEVAEFQSLYETPLV